jgi:hypothetical protein
MVVNHTGTESGTFNLKGNSSVALTLGAKKNTINVTNDSSARLNVNKNCGNVAVNMPGTPSVVKNPYGTYSLTAGSAFVEINADSIGLITVNGKKLSSYLPKEAAAKKNETNTVSNATSNKTTAQNTSSESSQAVASNNANTSASDDNTDTTAPTVKSKTNTATDYIAPDVSFRYTPSDKLKASHRSANTSRLNNVPSSERNEIAYSHPPQNNAFNCAPLRNGCNSNTATLKSFLPVFIQLLTLLSKPYARPSAPSFNPTPYYSFPAYRPVA